MPNERPMNGPLGAVNASGACPHLRSDLGRCRQMQPTIPHRRASRRAKDPIWEGINELLALGLIRWTCEHVQPDDWPHHLPLPIEFTDKADAIPRTEG
jgi:hypothetical protein